jgi:hypothetical protein
MKAITKDSDIEAGNTLFSPKENVRYTVNSYDYDSESKTEVAELTPKIPQGISKKKIVMTIEDLVKSGYKIED